MVAESGRTGFLVTYGDAAETQKLTQSVISDLTAEQKERIRKIVVRD